MSSGISSKDRGKPGGEKAPGAVYSTLCMVALAVFLIVKTSGLNYAQSDENIYFYMGKLVSEGKLPYRDFFFAHPPMGILVDSLVFTFFGFNFLALKILPVLAVATGGYLLYRAVLAAYDPGIALLSQVLFMFSYDVLRASAHPTGIDITVLFMLASFYFFTQRRFFICGLLVGLAGLSGLYSLVLPCAYVVFQLWRKYDLRGDVMALVLGFVITFGGVGLIFTLLTGRAYVDDVLFFQLSKEAADSQNASTISRVAGNNVLIFAPSLLLPFLLGGRRTKAVTALLAIIFLGYVAFFLNLKTLFDFYFMCIFPFAAVLSAQALVLLAELLRRKWFTTLLAVLVLLYSGWTISRYLDHERIYFEKAPEISDWVKSTTVKDEEVFGDSTTVPLIALLSGRRLALDEADTNIQRFTSNTTDINKLLARLKGDGSLRYIILHSRNGIETMPQMRAYVLRECRPAMNFQDRYLGLFIAYDCKH